MSDLVGNPEDRFSHNKARFNFFSLAVISDKETDEKTCHGCEKSTTKSRASPPKELALREAQKLLYQMASTTQVLTGFTDLDKIHYVNTPMQSTVIFTAVA